MNLLSITSHNGIRIAELGFLIGAIGAAVLAIAALSPSGATSETVRAARFFGALAIAAGFALLVIASHWGHFG
jgi:hypothetical protein